MSHRTRLCLLFTMMAILSTGDTTPCSLTLACTTLIPKDNAATLFQSNSIPYIDFSNPKWHCTNYAMAAHINSFSKPCMGNKYNPKHLGLPTMALFPIIMTTAHDVHLSLSPTPISSWSSTTHFWIGCLHGWQWHQSVSITLTPWLTTSAHNNSDPFHQRWHHSSSPPNAHQ